MKKAVRLWESTEFREQEAVVVRYWTMGREPFRAAEWRGRRPFMLEASTLDLPLSMRSLTHSKWPLRQAAIREVRESFEGMSGEVWRRKVWVRRNFKTAGWPC